MAEKLEKGRGESCFLSAGKEQGLRLDLNFLYETCKGRIRRKE